MMLRFVAVPVCLHGLRLETKTLKQQFMVLCIVSWWIWRGVGNVGWERNCVWHVHCKKIWRSSSTPAYGDAGPIQPGVGKSFRHSWRQFYCKYRTFWQTFKIVELLRQRWKVSKAAFLGHKPLSFRLTIWHSTTEPHFLILLVKVLSNNYKKEDTAACVIGHQGGNVNLYHIEHLNSHNCDNTSSLLQLRISLGLINHEPSKPHSVCSCLTGQMFKLVNKYLKKKLKGGGEGVPLSLLNLFDISSKFFVVEKVGLTSVLI
jgi:hypothetical protein